MPYRQSPYPAYQAAPLFWRSHPVCGGVSMKPRTIHRTVTQALLLLCSPPVWQIKGEVGVSWVAGGIVCACVCVYGQSSWAPQIGGHSQQGWLRPIRSECVQGENSPFSPASPKRSAYPGWEGLRLFCLCPVQKNWEEDESSSGQEGMASRVFSLEVSVCLCCSHPPGW